MRTPEPAAFYEIFPLSLNRQGEELCGDQVKVLRLPTRTIVVLSDGLGSGVKASILARLTTEIIVTKRVGVDLIPAIAAVLPLERHVRWSKLGKLRSGLAESLLGESGFELGRAMLGKGVKTVVGRGGLVGRLSTQIFTEKFLDNLASLAGETLRDLNSRALAKQDHMAATLTGFRMDLEQGEDLNVLLRSKR